MTEAPLRIRYHRRLLATALSFTVFGVSGTLAGLTLFPLIAHAPFSQARKRALARHLVYRFFSSFMRLMVTLGLLTWEVEGRERLGRHGQLILSNHPSLIDIIMLVTLVPDATCVVKGSLKTHPATAAAIRTAGYIPNDDTPAMIEAVREALARGEVVIMMPEGTRTVPGKPLCFHRGAASIALHAARVLTPVVIRMSPTTLTKAEPWYRIPPVPVYTSLIVKDDLDLQPYREMGAVPIASRELNDYLQQYFERERKTMTPLEREILQLVIDTLALEEVDIDAFDPESALFGSGLGLDSVDALELGLALHKKYGFQIDAKSDQSKAVFANLKTLAAYVAAQGAHG